MLSAVPHEKKENQDLRTQTTRKRGSESDLKYRSCESRQARDETDTVSDQRQCPSQGETFVHACVPRARRNEPTNQPSHSILISAHVDSCASFFGI
jgi:hypothetical protein